MKLTYFKNHARAQPIRLIFSLASIEFEDEIVEVSNDVEKWKELSQTFPLGQLPVLETDEGEVFPQTVAITNYLASTYGLKGDNARDAVVSSIIAETANELLTETGKGLHIFVVYNFLPSPGEEVIEKNKLGATTNWKRLCNIAEKYQRSKHSGKPFINGDKITEADIWLWSATDYIRLAIPDLECTEWYKELEKNFLDDEGVKKYLLNRFQVSF